MPWSKEAPPEDPDYVVSDFELFLIGMLMSASVRTTDSDYVEEGEIGLDFRVWTTWWNFASAIWEIETLAKRWPRGYSMTWDWS